MFLFQEEEESRMPTPLDFYNRPLMDTFVSTLATLIPEGSFLTKENPSLNALCVPHYPHDKAQNPGTTLADRVHASFCSLVSH